MSANASPTDPDSSNGADAATVSYVERSLSTFADALRRACGMLDTLSGANLRVLIAEANTALSTQNAYEHTAGHQWLSPRYFELANEVHEMRIQLVQRLEHLAAGQSNSATVTVLTFIAECRTSISHAKAVLEDVSNGELVKGSARRVYDRLPAALDHARNFASQPGLAALHHMLRTLITDLESTRAEALRLC